MQRFYEYLEIGYAGYYRRSGAGSCEYRKGKFTPSIAGSEQKYIDIISQEFVKNLWVSEDTAVYGYGYSNLHDYQIYTLTCCKKRIIQDILSCR